jgi:hypothetical protein
MEILITRIRAMRTCSLDGCVAGTAVTKVCVAVLVLGGGLWICGRHHQGGW